MRFARFVVFLLVLASACTRSTPGQDSVDAGPTPTPTVNRPAPHLFVLPINDNGMIPFDRFYSRLQSETLAAHKAARKKAGINMEGVWLQDFFGHPATIMYWESNDLDNAIKTTAGSGSTADTDFRTLLIHVHGMDLANGVPGVEPAFSFLETYDHNPAYAFVMMIKTGREADARAFAAEIAGPRAEDYRASRRALGITDEQVFFEQSPDYLLLLFYIEAPDPIAVVKSMCAPHGGFDTWFADFLNDATISGMNPLHLIRNRQMLFWRE